MTAPVRTRRRTTTASRAASAVVAVLSASACSTGGVVAQRGTLTAADIGPHWALTGVSRGSRFDEECESQAFNGSLPPRIAPRRTLETIYVRDPHHSRALDSAQSVYVEEYVMQFRDAAAAARALDQYKDIATQCATGGNDFQANGDEHIVDDTGSNVLSTRTDEDLLVSPGPTGARPTATGWLDFVVVGDRAIWLVAQNIGPVQVIRTLATKAVARLADTHPA